MLTTDVITVIRIIFRDLKYQIMPYFERGKVRNLAHTRKLS